MAKLTKYASFEDLKSEMNSCKTTSGKEKKLMSEFEAFLNLIQNEFSIKQKNKTVYGKQVNG